MSTTATQLRNKILQAVAASRFEALASEALGIYRELTTVRFNDDRDQKLSGPAYLREAIRNARTSTERLKKLEASLAEDPDGHKLVDAFLAAAYRTVAATRVEDGCALRPPAGNLHVIMRASRDEFTAVLLEVMAAGSSCLELIALATLRATEQEPSCFGAISDWKEHHERIAQQRARLSQLYGEIAQAAQAEQVVCFHHQGDALWRLTFQWRDQDTGIAFSPDAAAGERLVAWLAAR